MEEFTNHNRMAKNKNIGIPKIKSIKMIGIISSNIISKLAAINL
tara:strand:+ start:235 stop:366 length:132 start_codon:yes stop_codon:yes gene_type:complete